MRYGLPNLLRKLSSAGIGCSCAMSGRVMKASIAVMTAKRKQDTAAPKSESARWRMYTSECPKSNTRSRRSVSCICAQFDLYRQVGQHPATALAPPLGRSRDDHRWSPPAQIRTSAFTHTALMKDDWRRSEIEDKGAGLSGAVSTVRTTE